MLRLFLLMLFFIILFRVWRWGVFFFLFGRFYVIFFWKHNFYFTRCLLTLLYNFSCFYSRHLQFTFLHHFHYVFTFGFVSFFFAYFSAVISASVQHTSASCAYSTWKCTFFLTVSAWYHSILIIFSCEFRHANWTKYLVYESSEWKKHFSLIVVFFVYRLLRPMHCHLFWINSALLTLISIFVLNFSWFSQISYG